MYLLFNLFLENKTPSKSILISFILVLFTNIPYTFGTLLVTTISSFWSNFILQYISIFLSKSKYNLFLISILIEFLIYSEFCFHQFKFR